MSSQITPKCTSCDICPSLCPTESIYYGDGQYVIDTDTCRNCQTCIRVCPENAIIPDPENPTP